MYIDLWNAIFSYVEEVNNNLSYFLFGCNLSLYINITERHIDSKCNFVTHVIFTVTSDYKIKQGLSLCPEHEYAN